MQYTEYDRDWEAIDPLVPHFGDSSEQSTVSTDQPSSTDTEEPTNTLPSHLDQISYYTWDTEMIEPLVPIMAGPCSVADRR